MSTFLVTSEFTCEGVIFSLIFPFRLFSLPAPAPSHSSHHDQNNFMLGFLDKLSHDVLKRWQTRWFVLDARTKTIRYYTDKAKTDLKGEYMIQSISEDDAVSPDRLFSFVITGISSSLNKKKSDTASKSTLHISASTALLKDY